MAVRSSNIVAARGTSNLLDHPSPYPTDVMFKLSPTRSGPPWDRVVWTR